MILAAAVVVYVLMIGEAARAARNERAQLGRGGIEPSGDVYRIMQFTYPAAFLMMLGEGWMRGAPAPLILAPGILVFAAAKALKWWAIVSLGPFWTFRVIVVPGSRRVTSGPYRYLRHPNYVGVIGELAGVALIAGAIVTGPLVITGFALLVARRVAVENRALGAILPRS
jgi:methyltransferase